MCLGISELFDPSIDATAINTAKTPGDEKVNGGKGLLFNPDHPPPDGLKVRMLDLLKVVWKLEKLKRNRRGIIGKWQLIRQVSRCSLARGGWGKRGMGGVGWGWLLVECNVVDMPTRRLLM
jgi:hypothetical protein